MVLSFTLIVVMLGFGMVIPIFPFYIEQLGAGGSELGLLVATSAFMEFLLAPMWGSVSDRFGRKPIMIIGMLGNGISLVLFGLSTQLWMLFAARILSGMLSSATLPTSMAYVSDSTSEDNRGGGMGTLGAAMGLGVVLGPVLGGWLSSDSLSTPFFLAASLSIASSLLIYFLLPESLPTEARRHISSDKKRMAIQLSELWRTLVSPFGVLLLIAFLLSFGLTNFDAVFGLYALEKFNYSPQQVGTILMVVGIVSIIGKSALTGPLTKKYGESTVIKFSLLSGSIGFIVILLAGTYLTILLATGLFILSKTLLRPTVLSLTSKQATVGQGTAMGLTNSFMSLGRIIGAILAGFIFDINFNYPYISGSMILFIGFMISIIYLSKNYVRI